MLCHQLYPTIRPEYEPRNTVDTCLANGLSQSIGEVTDGQGIRQTLLPIDGYVYKPELDR